MMTKRMSWLGNISRLLHRHLLALIVLSYGLAAVAPAWGLWIKEAAVVDCATPMGQVVVTWPKLLLAVLLSCAGMRVRLARLGAMVRRPGVIGSGLAANLAVPLLFLALMVPALRLWHNPGEAAVVLVGLALVTSMPIAGSSTGWAQAADGDMALSLGLVLGSTLLSPLTTPASLHALGWLVSGPIGAQLHGLAGRDTGAFLACWVLLPSLLGIALRWVVGEVRVGGIERRLKVVAPITLLILCYANASACLPGVVRHPDWDFLGIVVVFVGGLCALTFTAGFGAGPPAGGGSGGTRGAGFWFGDEQQRHRTGPRHVGAGLGTNDDVADYCLQPGPAPDRGRCELPASLESSCDGSGTRGSPADATTPPRDAGVASSSTRNFGITCLRAIVVYTGRFDRRCSAPGCCTARCRTDRLRNCSWSLDRAVPGKPELKSRFTEVPRPCVVS